MELVNTSEMVSRENHPGEGNGKPPLSMCQENCDDQGCWHTEMEGREEDDQGENGWTRYMK